MNPRAQTTIVVIVAVLILLVWEVVVVYNNARDDLISNVVDNMGKYLAAIPFFFGALATHWFWPTREKLVTPQLLAALLLGGALTLTVANWILDYPDWWGVLCLVTGAGVGKLWWNTPDPHDKP